MEILKKSKKIFNDLKPGEVFTKEGGGDFCMKLHPTSLQFCNAVNLKCGDAVIFTEDLAVIRIDGCFREIA
jgi:hypothetical protein